MSNPCGAAQQAAAPYHFAINKPCWGEGCPIFQSEPIGYASAHQMVETIFRQQLPAHGMAVREGQIKLCHAMLDALYNKEVALCDAGVGLGKTYAYLVACLLWQSQRPRALWQPVVISTASVALQEAILQEYIPFLSSSLLQYGYFNKPIQAVLRKGKERFVCDLRLLERQRQMAQRGERFARRAAILRQAQDCLDLDKLPGLSGFDRRQICVPEHCPRLCPARSRCRYQRYLRESNGPAMSIQVCNHNYLLADALHRQNGWKPLLRDYQAVVIDEAHRLPEAAEQMLTKRLSLNGLWQLIHQLEQQHLTRGAQQLRAATEALAAVCQPQEPRRARAERQVPFLPTQERQTTLAALQSCIDELLRRYQARLPMSLRHQLQATSETAALFAQPQDDWITYIEYDPVPEGQTNTLFALCAVQRDQPGHLHELLWRREKPAILTSGTLAAGDDFTHIRRQLGLGDGTAVQTVQVASPFDYAKNCLLVFPPRPVVRQMDEPNEEATSHERLARKSSSLCARPTATHWCCSLRMTRWAVYMSSWKAGCRCHCSKPRAAGCGLSSSSNAAKTLCCWQAAPAGRVWTSLAILFRCWWLCGCRSRYLTRCGRPGGSNTPICIATSRLRSCPKCSRNCGKASAAPFVPRPTAVPSPSLTRGLRPAGGITRRCWMHCHPASRLPPKQKIYKPFSGLAKARISFCLTLKMIRTQNSNRRKHPCAPSALSRKPKTPT